MIGKLIKYYLSFGGREHLSPFWDGLVHLGEPTSIMFPSELLDQGLGLILSGLNNTLATQGTFNWVWPYWLEKQTDPDSIEFVPTGSALVTLNLTRRNWTSLGISDSTRESMIDPVGMLTPKAWGPSVFPYIKYRANTFLPPRMQPVQQLDGSLPRVITQYLSSGGLEWRSTTCALTVDGEELIDFSHQVKNATTRPIDLIFGLAVRPYNSLGIGHINILKFKNRLWRVNHRPFLLLEVDPDRVHISDCPLFDPILARDYQSGELKSKAGILSGVCEYDLHLLPDEEKTIETYAPIGKVVKQPDSRFSRVQGDNLANARRTFVSRFRDNEKKGMNISIPDKALHEAFLALKNHIHVFDDGGHFSPGTFFYHTKWLRDTTFIALAYENLSWQNQVKRKISGILDLQRSDGFFCSQNGEWDSNGEALFAVVNHIRHDGDERLAIDSFAKLAKGARWIEKACRGGKNVRYPGLLPPGMSAEHFGPNSNYYWDDFWSLAGLKELLWLTEKLGKNNSLLQEFLADFQYYLLASVEGATENVEDRCLPCSPSRGMDCAAIGNLVAISPLNLFEIDVFWLRPTVNYLWDHFVRDGLFFHKIIHTGLNPYLSIQLARALLAMNDSRFFDILKGVLSYASPTLTWPEAIHPKTKGGCMGDGDHGWACAEFLSLVRDMLVRETAGGLHLAYGVPSHWLEFGVADASTRFGTVDYKLAGGILVWQIRRNSFQDRVPLYFKKPDGLLVELIGDSGVLTIEPDALG